MEYMEEGNIFSRIRFLTIFFLYAEFDVFVFNPIFFATTTYLYGFGLA